jgi:hypothetical protein
MIGFTSDQSIPRWARVGAIGVVGVATIGLVDLFGAPTGAQSADVVAELVSVDADGAALGGTNTRPSVSADGNTIVFTNFSPAVGDDPGVYDLIVRRRAADAAATGALLVAVGSTAPVEAAVSGDGCVVAYSTVVPRPVEEIIDDAGGVDDAQLDDPLADPASGVVADDAVAAPQVAGEVIELRALHLCGVPGIEPTSSVLDRIDGDAADEIMPLSAPALASDGSIVAFATQAAVAMYDVGSTPEQPAVVSINAPGAEQLIGHRLDVTADGRTVVFEAGLPTADPDDAANVIDASVYLATFEPAVDAGLPAITGELFAPTDVGSSWPSISADGTFVAYQSDQPLPIDGIPAEGSYIVLAERSATGTTHRLLTDTAVRPDLASNGEAIAYDIFGSVLVRRSESVVPFQDFSERIVNQKVDVEFAEGAGASVSGVALSGDGTTAVFDQPAGAVLANPALPGAHVWAQATDPLFAPPPTPTTIDNATTTTTTISVTQPTVPGTPTTRPTRRNTTRTTTRNTTRSTVATTASPVPQPVTFAPSAFEFAPTIINAGRRTAAVNLSNPTSDGVTVSSVIVDAAGAADFTVDAAGCTAVAPGATCPVSVAFAPSEAGERTTTVVATLSDGSTATLALRGIGAPAPTLSVLPGVASNGQVVAVIGSGFPAGATVEFSWNDDVVTSSIVIDDVGGFTETKVVLPNTTSGPMQLVVAAQTDLFGEVSTTLLVSDSPSRGNTAVLGGGITGASLGR